jgi:hypothetical protein
MNMIWICTDKYCAAKAAFLLMTTEKIKHPSKRFISTGPHNSNSGNQCHYWASNIQYLLTAARKNGQ